MTKIGRNDPCWCGNGKKYKKCHLGKPADNSHNDLESTFGEFGARSMSQSLDAVYKNNGVLPGKSNVMEILDGIMEGKKTGNRPKPSSKVVLGESKFSDKLRSTLIDVVGNIVDQNWCGRSEMCVLFAILLSDTLNALGANAKAIIGKGTYYGSDKTEFTWDHAWVLVDDEIVDGNVDSTVENPAVPDDIEPNNYWGKIYDLPEDRVLNEDKAIDEDWVKQNTTYKILEEWRTQLKNRIKGLSLN